MNEVITIGVDLAKNVFQVHGVDAEGAVVVRRQLRRGRIVGRGRATAAAASRLARGVAWDRAATPAPNAGNGSAMRAGPVGCMFWNDPDALIEAAGDQGRITHADLRCAAGPVPLSRGSARVSSQDTSACDGTDLCRLEAGPTVPPD